MGPNLTKTYDSDDLNSEEGLKLQDVDEHSVNTYKST